MRVPLRILPAMATALLGALAVPPGPLAAQAPPASSFEAGGFFHRVSHDFGDWKGGYARAVLEGGSNVWYLDARLQEAFHDRGAYAGLANVHTFSSRFYSQIGAGAGSGDLVFPDLRLDGSLNLKLGSARALILTAGGTLVDAKAGYRDRALFGSLTWYAGGSLLLEGGGRINWSDPGAVTSARGFGSLTAGRSSGVVVILRASAGTEGYQLTGLSQTLREFSSQDAGVTIRLPVSRSFGVALGGDWYHNPFYTRSGGSAGLFHAW